MPALLEIEQASFSHPCWTARDFLADRCQVAEVNGEVAGLLVSKQIFAGDAESPAEREILNLAVKESFRRQGIASELLRQELGRKAIYYLEVRESNVAAQTLYLHFGFKEIARRAAYYRSPVETAIVMSMKWC